MTLTIKKTRSARFYWVVCRSKSTLALFLCLMKFSLIKFLCSAEANELIDALSLKLILKKLFFFSKKMRTLGLLKWIYQLINQFTIAT